MGTIVSKPVSNLIQGVSQQSAQQRRDSQCESQFDCMNSPKDGAVARNGADVVRFYPGLDFAGAYPYELVRGRIEHYLVLARDRDAGGLQVLNLDDGAMCTVTKSGSADDYLSLGGQPPADSWAAQTVDDYTFLANKTVRPGYTAARSLTRPREALVFFKAGAYSSVYAISLLLDGITYRWLYNTPDNSIASNASYIATNYLAAIFYRAMTGSAGGGASGGMVGAVYPGDPGTGSVSADNSSTGGGNPTLAQLGFSIAINGNLLRIWRNDGRNFTIDTTDGAGDTYLLCFKDTIRSFSELPRGGFEGFTLRVKAKPGQSDGSADYWVEYVKENASLGFWRERAAPNVLVELAPSLMPHALVNTAPNTFDFRPMVWSQRIAGDGEDSAKDPGFVGKRIEDLFFHKGRLALLTESTCDFSKARNVFTHFPDTVQTLLSDAPIGLQLSASDTVALLRRSAKVAESLFLWAQGAQFRISAGQDPFRQDTVEASDSTSYEFAEQSNFARVGATLYFATEPNGFTTLRNLTFNNGQAVGDVDVTAHVSEYIPAGVRRLSSSDTGQMIFVRTDGDPASLYLYNYLVQDRTVVQSAWCKWRLPVDRIVWASVYRLDLYVLGQRADGAVLLKVPLSAREVDPGGAYLTRLDLRVTEASCAVTYDALADASTIRPAFSIAAGDIAQWRVVTRASGDLVRGREGVPLGAAAGGFTVSGDWRSRPFYLGRLIVSERTESTFYLRTEGGVVPSDTVNLREFNLRYAATGYTRLEADIGAGRPVRRVETKHIPIGGGPAISQPPTIKPGRLSIAIDAPNEETTVRLVNDTWLPSRWQTADWRHDTVVRARVGQAGGSQ